MTSRRKCEEINAGVKYGPQEQKAHACESLRHERIDAKDCQGEKQKTIQGEAAVYFTKALHLLNIFCRKLAWQPLNPGTKKTQHGVERMWPAAVVEIQPGLALQRSWHEGMRCVEVCPEQQDEEDRPDGKSRSDLRQRALDLPGNDRQQWPKHHGFRSCNC